MSCIFLLFICLFIFEFIEIQSKKVKNYSDLCFAVKYNESTYISWSNIKSQVGSIHMIKEDNGLVPTICIWFQNISLSRTDLLEAKMWSKVEFLYESINYNHCRGQYDRVIELLPNSILNPLNIENKRALLLDDIETYIKYRSDSRNSILMAVNDHNNTNSLLRFPKIHSDNMTQNFIIDQKHMCYIDINETLLHLGASPADILDQFALLSLRHLEPSKRSLAIGLPTTSKTETRNSGHVLLNVFFPSLANSLKIQELKFFNIVIFIGFDEGDYLFEQKRYRDTIKLSFHKIFPKSVVLIFFRLTPLKRIAMTWNMIFLQARNYMPFDYYYQVNDDLFFKTKGWLTLFVQTLENSEDIGVVGPSDNFRQFSCSLLTQTFVSKKHFEIFNNQYFPIEIPDWKSDRWLSFVYSNKTFCYKNVIAENGAKKTRYSGCNFPEWKTSLFTGKKLVKSFIANQKNSADFTHNRKMLRHSNPNEVYTYSQ